MNILLSALFLLLLSYLAYRLIRLAWYKLHEIAGIEVGMSQYSLPPSPVSKQPLRLAYQANTPIPNTFGSDRRFGLLPHTVKSKQKVTSPKTRLRRQRYAAQAILGIDRAAIERMPTAAVILLDDINDKLIRYQEWQHEQSQQLDQQTQWLTENKFVLSRLIEQTIPEAVSQYDQIAKYHPSQLAEKIHGEMNAGEMLTEVLARVNNQLDELLNDLFQDVSQQFASTYRYVKNRT